MVLLLAPCFVVALNRCEIGLKSAVGCQQGRLRRSKNGRSSRLVVRAEAKQTTFDQKSRAALQAGVEKLANAVGVTLGPRGEACQKSTFLSQRSVQAPLKYNPTI